MDTATERFYLSILETIKGIKESRANTVGLFIDTAYNDIDVLAIYKRLIKDGYNVAINNDENIGLEIRW